MNRDGFGNNYLNFYHHLQLKDYSIIVIYYTLAGGQSPPAGVILDHVCVCVCVHVCVHVCKYYIIIIYLYMLVRTTMPPQCLRTRCIGNT